MIPSTHMAASNSPDDLMSSTDFQGLLRAQRARTHIHREREIFKNVKSATCKLVNYSLLGFFPVNWLCFILELLLLNVVKAEVGKLLWFRSS